MADPQISSFEELLAHLDGLTEAAWKAGVDPRMARQLAAARHRVVRIQAHLTGDASPGSPAPRPEPKTLASGEDLVAQLRQTNEAARASRALPTTVTHYLNNIGNRLNLLLRSGEHRLASREVPDEGANAVLAVEGERLEVTVLDRSAFGVGIQCPTPVNVDRVGQLYCPDKPQGAKTYECLTVHCRESGDGYHVGLEIFTTKLSGGAG